MSFRVRFTPEGEEDLVRLLDVLLERATSLDDVERAQQSLDAVREAILAPLSRTPCSFRKAGRSPTRRELVVPCGATGYVALQEIADASTVLVLAIRHRREEDCH